MKSNITFTYDYSTDYVYFLDTKVKFKEQRRMTEIYSKPTASFQYLYRTSYHPPHTFHSILRYQFIRIRRICSDINEVNEFKGSPRKSVKFKHHRYKSGTTFSLQKRLQVIKSAILTRTEIITIWSPIREAEGPENVRKWLLWKHLKTGTDNKQNAFKNSPARP